MVWNPFKKSSYKSVEKVFSKSGSIGKIFTKDSADKFRDTLSNVLDQQGSILAKAGGIAAGVLGNPVTLGVTAALAPELLPVLAVGAGLSAFGAGVGGAEVATSGLLQPSTYKGNKAAVTGNVLEKLDKGTRSAVKGYTSFNKV